MRQWKYVLGEKRFCGVPNRTFRQFIARNNIFVAQDTAGNAGRTAKTEFFKKIAFSYLHITLYDFNSLFAES